TAPRESEVRSGQCGRDATAAALALGVTPCRKMTDSLRRLPTRKSGAPRWSHFDTGRSLRERDVWRSLRHTFLLAFLRLDTDSRPGFPRAPSRADHEIPDGSQVCVRGGRRPLRSPYHV